MNKFKDLYFQKLDLKISSLQWDIDYYEKTNPELWADEIPRLKHIIVGLKVAKQIYENLENEIERGNAITDALNGMNDKLEKMIEILDKKDETK
jgi:hypothetical protein